MAIAALRLALMIPSLYLLQQLHHFWNRFGGFPHIFEITLGIRARIRHCVSYCYELVRRRMQQELDRLAKLSSTS